jgi:PAS domain S-box-containing protein
MKPNDSGPASRDRDGRPQGSESFALAFLQGGGEMGALIRRKDWTQSPLGSTENWPHSLRSAVSICLGSGFPIAIYWGPELALLYNDAWRPIPGAKHPWALGQAASEVWPEIWDTIGPLFEHVMTTGEATRSRDQLLAMRRHGYTEECYFDYTFSPIRGESGQVEGIFNAVLETTGRVIGERRLHTVRELAGRVSEARTAELACRLVAHTLGNAFADVPFAVLYLLSSNGTEARLAGSAGLNAGAPAAPESIPLSGPENMPGVSAAGAAWPVAQVVRTGVAQLVDDLIRRFGPLPGGPWPESPTSALVLPVARAGSERPYGVLVAGVSPRRTLDDDYRAFFDIVVSHIAQALSNAEAHEEERKRAEALAEIDRAKTAFFSNVSHEFRTPLTLMLGPLEEMLAMNASLPAAAAELTSITHRNCLRLQKLVNTLLDFSRIEAGRAQASYQPTDLAALTSELSSSFRSAVQKAGLRLIVDCPMLREPVYVDREMWEKVVLNLLSNAFKYTFEGTISVRLSAQDNLATLTIEDTGAGIPRRELPHLFKRFHRVEGVRGRTQEGTGIGLALVAELVKLHGGRVEAQSVAGQGSTFTVSIPFGTAHLPCERLSASQDVCSNALHAEYYVDEASRWLPAQTVPAAAPHETKGQPRGRVLLVDDNADMRDYAARLLAERYAVQAVANGEEALVCALADPPDLVLTDVMMPGMGGFGLLHALRSRPQTSVLPVILVSARAGEEARVEGLDSGASDYLVKPFTARELLARVGAHIGMARVRKQAADREAKLRAEAEASHHRVVTVLESITDAFATFDREWRFIYVNAETERMVGKRREELLGLSHWDVFAATRGTAVEREYRRAVRDQSPVELEYLYEPWERWFAIKGYPTQEGGLSIYFRDITAQKEAEAHLRESEQRLRAIFDGTYEYIGLLAPDGTLLETNRASLEFAGYRREDVIGQPFWDTPWFAGTPGAQEDVRHAVMRAAEGEFLRYETTLLRPSGELVDFDVSLHPIRNECGEVVLIVPEGRNITERKQAEQRMRQQWHTFDAALSHTPDFTYTFDLEGRFTYVNRALLSLWQKPLEEALGKNFFDLEYPPELAARLQNQIQRVIDSRQPLRDHTPFTGPAGETRDYEYIFAPVLAANGQVEAVAGSTRDITERKRGEEQERERQIQLRDSARLESLGVMAGGIAHDFNNLLVGILGYASLLAETGFPSDRPMAGQIVVAAERAAALTKQMLAYSGKGSFVIEAIDLNTLIQENLTRFRSSVSRNVGIELELSSDACVVEGDRAQIHQAIMNLLINASEAVGDRPGEVRICTALVEGREPRFSTHLHEAVPAGNYALLEVRDNGAGMTSETVKKIFDPFFTTKFTGRGLGLAAVLGIVKGHRGDIVVESHPGAGATFRIYLPLSERAGATGRRPEASAAAAAAGQTVLVVDDEAIVRKLATLALERRGFRVLAATDGQEALDVLGANPGVSLVILDLTMPVMTGEQTLPVIRARYPEIPVILSSGFNEAEISRRFASSGIAGVLQKPYTISGIVLKVVQAIQHARPSQSQSSQA